MKCLKTSTLPRNSNYNQSPSYTSLDCVSHPWAHVLWDIESHSHQLYSVSSLTYSQLWISDSNQHRLWVVFWESDQAKSLQSDHFPPWMDVRCSSRYILSRFPRRYFLASARYPWVSLRETLHSQSEILILRYFFA